MASRLDYGWRLFATGMSFLLFGLCGCLFSLLIFPFLCLWPRQGARQRGVAALIHRFFRALVFVLRKVGVMELEVTGGQALRSSTPVIVIANHPTYLDVMVLLALKPMACCVVKGVHWGNPCFWGIVRAAGYVSNADPMAMVEAGSRQVASGYSMIIFPEGTRSPGPNQLHPFLRGFAHMALKGNTAILPVLMDCDPPVFTKQLRWYDIPARPFRMRVRVLDPVSTAHHQINATPPVLAARTLTHELEMHINRHLIDYGFFKT